MSESYEDMMDEEPRTSESDNNNNTTDIRRTSAISIPTTQNTTHTDPLSSPKDSTLHSDNNVGSPSNTTKSLSEFYNPEPSKTKHKRQASVTKTISSSPSRRVVQAQTSFQNHNFKPQKFDTPTECGICQTYIWGLVSHGYRCEACDLCVHTSCFPLVRPNSCEKKRIKIRGTKVFVRTSSFQPEVLDSKQPGPPAPIQEIPFERKRTFSNTQPENDNQQHNEKKVSLPSKPEEDSSSMEDLPIEIVQHQIIEDKDMIGEFLQLQRTKSALFYRTISRATWTYDKELRTAYRAFEGTPHPKKEQPDTSKPKEHEITPPKEPSGAVSPFRPSTPIGTPPTQHFQNTAARSPSPTSALDPKRKSQMSPAQSPPVSPSMSPPMSPSRSPTATLRDPLRWTSSQSGGGLPVPVNDIESLLLRLQQTKNDFIIESEIEDPLPDPSLATLIEIDDEVDDPLPSYHDVINSRRYSIDVTNFNAYIDQINTSWTNPSRYTPIKNTYKLYEIEGTPQVLQPAIKPHQLRQSLTEQQETVNKTPTEGSTKPEVRSIPELGRTLSRNNMRIRTSTTSPVTAQTPKVTDPPATVGRRSNSSRNLQALRPKSNSVSVGARPASIQTSPVRPQDPKRFQQNIDDLLGNNQERVWTAMAMGEDDSCLNLELKLLKDEYIPGDTVAGSVHLDLLKPLQKTLGVKVLLQGFEKAFQGYTGFKMEGNLHKKKKWDYETKMFFKNIITLWEPSATDPILHAGQHTWSFSVKLPINLPPTVYFEDWTAIVYQIRAFVDPARDPITKKPLQKTTICSDRYVFDVYGANLNMWENMILKFSRSIQVGDECMKLTAKVYSSDKKHSLRLNAQVDRKDYHAGEIITVKLKIENLANQKVGLQFLEVCLVQQVKVHLKSFQCEFHDKVLFNQSFDFKGFKVDQNSTAEKSFHISVPEDSDNPILPTTTGLLFTIAHCVRLNINGAAHLDLPIRLWEHPVDTVSDADRRPQRGPSVVLAPSDWRFSMIRAWSRPTSELPISVDLLKVIQNITVVDCTSMYSRKLQGQQEYIIAMFDYQSSNTTMPNGDKDLSFKKGDVFLVLETCANSWLRVESANGQVGLIPSNYVSGIGVESQHSEKRPDQQVLQFLGNLSFAVESKMTVNSNTGLSRQQELEQQYLHYTKEDTAVSDHNKFSSQLNNFINEHLNDGSITGRLLKACTTSVLSPPVIEMTLNLDSKVTLGDAGGWRIGIIVDKDEIKVSHWKKHKCHPKENSTTEVQTKKEQPELVFEMEDNAAVSQGPDPRYTCTFETELAISFDRQASNIVDISFRLYSSDFSVEAPTRDSSFLPPEMDESFQRWKIDTKKTLDAFFAANAPLLNTLRPSKYRTTQPVKAEESLLTDKNRQKSRANWKEQTSADIHKFDTMMQNSLSDKKAATQEKPVSKFFGLVTPQQLRDIDVLHGNYHAKLHNLSACVDEDEALYQSLPSETRNKITLQEKVKRKWKKNSDELLIITLIPTMYQKIDIATSDGLLRPSSFYENFVMQGADNNMAEVQELQQKVARNAPRLRSFIEAVSILLHDTKDTLPSLVRHWSSSEEDSVSFFAKFYKDHMKEDTPTMRLLKTISVTIVHSAFVILKEYFDKKFPFSDIPSAWKISFLIGRGDGTQSDRTVVTHTKAAKSKDISPEESFEFLWQLKLIFNYEMTELIQLSVQITALQTSPRFPTVKLKELQHLTKTFNELNHSRIVSKKQNKKVNPKREHEMRKKLRQKLRQVPSYDMISTTLRRDCSVHVKVIEARHLAAIRPKAEAHHMTHGKKRSPSLLAKMSNIIGNSDPNVQHPYCIVEVGQVKYRTRTIFESSSRPYWFEEHLFNVENPLEQQVRLSFYDAKVGDMILGSVVFPVRVLKNDVVVEDWFPVVPPGSDPSKEAREATEEPRPQTRLKLRYTEEVVLPLPLYDEMLTLLEDKDLRIVVLLSMVSEDKEERETILSSLLKVSEFRNTVHRLLAKLIRLEIENTTSTELIFRGNSFATKALDIYMRFIGGRYLVDTLEPIVKKVYNSKKSYDLDTTGTLKDKTFKNTANLIQKTLDAIYKSIDKCPVVFRELFYEIQSMVEYKYPDQAQVTRYTAISGFIILRFFCPALTSPKLYNIVEDHPDLSSSRTLMTVAKVIQKLANLQDFKDEALCMFNNVIEANKGVFKQFIDSISKVPGVRPPHVRPPVVIEKELASVHRFLKRYRERMSQRFPDDISMKKLESILDNLEYISEHEKLYEYPHIE